jgi:cell division protein FtsB
MAWLAGTMGAWAVTWVLSTGPAKPERAEALKQQAEKLATEAKALANPSGCEKVEECEVAGFGHKACGGPREYITYCAKTTDVKALQGKLAELEKAEKTWQTETGEMSNCGLTRRPLPRFVDGQCRIR